MSNTFAASSLVIKYITMHLWNNLTAGRCCYREIAKELTNGNYNTGGTVTIQKPFEFRPTTGATISSVPDLYARSFTMSATTRYKIPFQFLTQELTYDFFVNQTQERIIMPTCASLANQVDYLVLQNYKKIINQVGTPGTTPNSTRIVRQARERMNYFGVPTKDCHLFLDSAAVTELDENLKGLLSQKYVDDAVDGVNIDGVLAMKLANFTCYESNNIPRHTTGTGADAAITKDGASSDEDTTLALAGLGAGQTVTEGDLWTVADTYAVNPMSGIAYPFLRQWVAGPAGATGVSGTADGAGKLSAQTAFPGTAPYNIRSATAAAAKLPYQNVSGLPGNGKSVTIAGAASTIYPISLAFHRNAIALATVPLEMPRTAVFKARQDYEGISLRITGDYDLKNDLEIYRVDLLMGTDVMEPQAGCRIIG